MQISKKYIAITSGPDKQLDNKWKDSGYIWFVRDGKFYYLILVSKKSVAPERLDVEAYGLEKTDSNICVPVKDVRYMYNTISHLLHALGIEKGVRLLRDDRSYALFKLVNFVIRNKDCTMEDK